MDAPPELQPRIVHADEWLLVIEKPAGLIVHEAPGHSGPTLVGLLSDRAGGGEDPSRPGIVHRIDRDTSGLLIVARTDEAHARLARMIAARQVSRRYTALVSGRPPSRSGKIDAPLGRDHRRPERVVVGGRRARAAVTHFEVVESFEHDSLLEVRLETGRTHQIRAHMAAIGHPIAGDPVYGGAGRHGLARQFLHAAGLAFEHPADGAPVSFESPLPDDLLDVLTTIRAQSNL